METSEFEPKIIYLQGSPLSSYNMPIRSPLHLWKLHCVLTVWLDSLSLGKLQCFGDFLQAACYACYKNLLRSGWLSSSFVHVSPLQLQVVLWKVKIIKSFLPLRIVTLAPKMKPTVLSMSQKIFPNYSSVHGHSPLMSSNCSALLHAALTGPPSILALIMVLAFPLQHLLFPWPRVSF